MSKIFFPFIMLLFIGLSSCDKGEQILKNDIKEIEDYLSDNGLSAERTEDDLFYIVEEEGNGEFPSTSDVVIVDYHGYFTSGSVFDSSVENGTPLTTSLGNVIRGWREGIPFFSKGGKGKLLIPSHLGYGEFGSGSIPANTVLIFDIHLIDF